MAYIIQGNYISLPKDEEIVIRSPIKRIKMLTGSRINVQNAPSAFALPLNANIPLSAGEVEFPSINGYPSMLITNNGTDTATFLILEFGDTINYGYFSDSETILNYGQASGVNNNSDNK